MTQNKAERNKIPGKFYPLQHEELIDLNKRLTASELSVYLWLKTNEPFGDKLVEADTLTIALDLNISRRSVQRALVKLRKEKLIDLVITKFHYRVKSKPTAESDNTNENSDNTSKVKEKLRVATSVSPDDISVAKVTSMSSSVRECRQGDINVAIGTPMSPPSAETKSEQSVQNPKTLQTYSDFKRSLSESARENFFSYVKEQTKNLAKPINDLEAWLASKNAANQNRWEAYYNLYQTEELKRKAINESQNTSTRQLTLEEERRAIANFKNRHNRASQEDTSQPVNTNSEEARRSQAAFDELLSASLGEKTESLADRTRRMRREAEQKRQELARQRREAAEERAKQQNPDQEQRKAEMLRQVEEFNQRQHRQNPENNQ